MNINFQDVYTFVEIKAILFQIYFPIFLFLFDLLKRSNFKLKKIQINISSLMIIFQLQEKLFPNNNSSKNKQIFIQNINNKKENNYLTFSIARELNQTGLNLYFQNCLSIIKDLLSKKKTTQKEYITILKRFYQLLFDNRKIQFQINQQCNFQNFKNKNMTVFSTQSAHKSNRLSNRQ
ncbi:unnamed protein product [Paramecium primaurelia]|uniref:Transmembrane protein n=1 Tax=Paramecium primaurelia TaxID=5886 RepID=A0A8S1NPE7_PARPR|nr:unnamed protein product [Paramecium primaurelia]